MRIKNIQISHWRHFENVELQLDQDVGLICLVGANGTGKSHLLELIAACAHQFGLSQGADSSRGNPLADFHDFSVTFFIAEGVVESLEEGLRDREDFGEWDRTLTLRSRKDDKGEQTYIDADSIQNPSERRMFAKQVAKLLSKSEDVHFLSLDADRAYPKKNINVHEIAQAYEIDWSGTEYTRGRSFKRSDTLYDEWIKYFLAQENQSGTRLIKKIRQAREGGLAEPAFKDHFAAYKDSLQRILPHVVFSGVDSRRRTLLFDTTGMELSFDQLSGGEREIAFLVGQIDRFGLRQGVFLLDEPELHLNGDLIRSWVSFLTSTVNTGQIWLATHSLEAVEAAGQQATFVLERSESTRKVNSIARLDKKPVLTALSRAVGSPAFSISQVLFVFVEGEENIGERERYRKLVAGRENIRFMECGSCTEVLRKVEAIRSLSGESETELRIAGIVDKDFQSTSEAEGIESEYGVYVLRVHEIENFFLHPDTLGFLVRQNGLDSVYVSGKIQEASDVRAGSWIFQHAMSTRNAKTLPKIETIAKERAKNLDWNAFTLDVAGTIKSIVCLSGYNDTDASKLTAILEISTKAYERARSKPCLWKRCEGKQVLNQVARVIGFPSATGLASAAFVVWENHDGYISEELQHLRQFIANF